MVDKVFADWQKNSEHESPNLDTERRIAPFGSTEFNKFRLTNIPPDKTLDFESNLCYCYDCDLEQDFNEVKLPKRTGDFLSGGQPIFLIKPPTPRPIFDQNLFDSDEHDSLVFQVDRGGKFDSLTGFVR